MKYRSSNGLAELAGTGIGCIMMFAAVLLPSWLLAFWTQANIDQLALQYSTAEVHCPFWLAWLLSLVAFPLTLLLNIITEIVQLFM